VPPRGHPGRRHSQRHTATRCAIAIACLAVLAGATSAPAAVGSPGGGTVFVAKPIIKKVRCVRRCARRHRAQVGSTLRISGSDLQNARWVTFHGSFGRRDDRRVYVRPGTSRRVRVRVPFEAVTGAVSVSVSRSVRSRRSKTVPILPAPPPDPNPTLSPVPGPRDAGGPQLETGTSRTVFYLSGRSQRFSYRVRAAGPVQVSVNLIRASDGVVAYTWSPAAAQPSTIYTVTWRGSLNHLPAPSGRYSFRLNATRAGRTATSTRNGDITRDAFDLRDHVFPIRARHNFGGPEARFGAARSGHRHQGQDTFARCGARLVAARGGKVIAKAYQGAAGNYLVIRGSKGAGLDYFYAHMAEPSPFERGDRVLTGQRIGSVGDTGDAVGCHLHLELWTKPGWYEGGHPFDPLPALRYWDSYS
jgi:murein DD-endopeptidase MepM/ murein hydrolase activator NlpD